MKRPNKKRKYESQALAMAMVVLVVASLIGISVYSRSIKDKGLTLEERASAEALGVSDVIIDRLIQFPVDVVIDKIAESEGGFDTAEGIVLKENKDQDGISRLFNLLGILEGSGSVGDMISPLCELSKGRNEYQLSLKEADEDTDYEIRAGQSWSLPVKNLVNEQGCLLKMIFTVRGDSRAGFVLTKLYCKYDEEGNVEECKEYALEDMESYCFSDEGAVCNNDNFLDVDNWLKYDLSKGKEESIGIEIEPQGEAEYILGEVRIKAVGGTVGISYTLSSECPLELRMYELRISANCSGVYRGKEILIPEIKWYNTIFDYVLFNGEGSV